MAHLSGEAHTALEERGHEHDQRIPFPLHGLSAHRVSDQRHRLRLPDRHQCHLHIHNRNHSAENQGGLRPIHGQSGSEAVSRSSALARAPDRDVTFHAAYYVKQLDEAGRTVVDVINEREWKK